MPQTTQAATDLKEVLDALAKYGQHRAYCPLTYDDDANCTCGLNALLERHGREGVS